MAVYLAKNSIAQNRNCALATPPASATCRVGEWLARKGGKARSKFQSVTFEYVAHLTAALRVLQ